MRKNPFRAERPPKGVLSFAPLPLLHGPPLTKCQKLNDPAVYSDLPPFSLSQEKPSSQKFQLRKLRPAPGHSHSDLDPLPAAVHNEPQEPTGEYSSSFRVRMRVSASVGSDIFFSRHTCHRCGPVQDRCTHGMHGCGHPLDLEPGLSAVVQAR